MSRLQTPPDAVVAQITIQMLANGDILANASAPSRPVLNMMLEEGKQVLLEHWNKASTAPVVLEAPAGMTVARNPKADQLN